MNRNCYIQPVDLVGDYPVEARHSLDRPVLASVLPVLRWIFGVGVESVEVPVQVMRR